MPWRRFLLLIVFNLALHAVLVTINDYLARASIHLHLDVLYLLLPGLYFPAAPAFFAVVFQGFIVSAWWPPEAGFLPLLYGGIMLLILVIRHNLRRDNPVQIALLAVVVNTLLLTLFATILGPGQGSFGSYFSRILGDGLLSTLVILLCLPRFLQGYLALFRLAGMDLAAEPVPRH